MGIYNLDDARRLMEEAHANQIYDNKPYKIHPEAVRQKALALFSTIPFIHELPFQAACLLHDVAEDQAHRGYTLDFIEQKTERLVRDYVAWVTKPQKPDNYKRLSHEDRTLYKLQSNQEHYLALGEKGPREAQTIKICDRLVNLEDVELQPIYFVDYYIADTKNLNNALGTNPWIPILVDRLNKIKKWRATI